MCLKIATLSFEFSQLLALIEAHQSATNFVLFCLYIAVRALTLK